MALIKWFRNLLIFRLEDDARDKELDRVHRAKLMTFNQEPEDRKILTDLDRR